MSQFTIVVPDKVVINEVTHNGQQIAWGFNDLDLSYISTDVHAVQWNTTTKKGHVEKTDYSVEEITDLGIYKQSLTEWETKWSAGPGNTTEPTDAQKLDQLRYERNILLAETDWMAGSDITMSDAWKTYRQALRDYPSTVSDVDNPPAWPTKPN